MAFIGNQPLLLSSYLRELYDVDDALSPNDGEFLTFDGTSQLWGTTSLTTALTSLTTDDITEGSLNLYYSSSLFDTDLASKTTDDLSEGGANQYYSSSLFDNDFSLKSSDDLSEGVSNLYYNSTLFDNDLASKTTDDLLEGTLNKYYSDTLARDAFSVVDTGGDGSLVYDGASGVFTYTGPSADDVRGHFSAGDGITITAGEIAHADTSAQVDSSNVQGFVLQNIGFDDFGHVTSFSNTNLDERYYTETEIDTTFVPFTGGTLTGHLTLHADPSNALHAATKQYVDEVAQGITTKPAVRVASTANLSGTYNNGTDGAGAYINLGTAAILNIDGVETWSQYDGVLVRAQTNAFENGRYYISQVGDAGTDWILTRCGYCDTADEIPSGYVFVQEGDQYAGTGWIALVENPESFTVGTDDINWTQFSGAGTYTAGTDLELNGTVFSLSSIIGADTTGNAASATILETSRTIALDGDVSGSVSFNGGADVTITTVIADDSHNHVISNVDGLQTALDAKLATASFSTTADTWFGTKNTGQLTEGTNKYYTDARARAALSAGGDLSYNNSTGVISFTERTDSEVRGLLSASGDLSYNNSTGVFSVTTYKSADFDTDFATKTTDDLAEGTNKYYTDARVQAVSINNLVEDTTPQLGGTLDANGNTIDMGTNVINDAKVGEWITAYGWGNHASVGYLTDITGQSIGDLSDVDITTVAPTNGQVLKWNGSAFVPGNDDEGTTINSIDDIGDVDITTTAPTDGQALVWDAANSKFVPGNVASGGGLTEDFTTTTTTSQVAVDSFAKADYRGGEYLFMVSSMGNFTILKALIIHDGTDTYMTTYGEVGYTLGGTFDHQINGDDVEILFTPTVANTTVKFTRILLSNSGLYDGVPEGDWSTGTGSLDLSEGTGTQDLMG